jgi:RNase P subunit RPR2
MKVIKKPKYKNVTCKNCLAVLKPQPKDLLRISEGFCLICPLCRRNSVFKLEDLIEDELQSNDN